VSDVADRSSIKSLSSDDAKDFQAIAAVKGEKDSDVGFVVFESKDCAFSRNLQEKLDPLIVSSERKFWVANIEVDLKRLSEIRQGLVVPINNQEKLAEALGVNATPVVLLYKNKRFGLAKKRDLEKYL